MPHHTLYNMLPLNCVLLDSIHRCNSLRSFKNIHALLVTTGIVSGDLVVNGAVGFFQKSGEFVDYACDFLKKYNCRVNSFSFSKLIARYAASDRPQTAVLVYRRIVRDGFWPDMHIFPAVLKSCAKFTGIGEGKQVHGVVVKMGFMCDLYVQNSLVYYYSVCGDCMGAGRMFDEMLVRDEVSWSCIISGYVRAGFFDEAVALYLRMDVEPNITNLVSVLGACGRKEYLGLGKAIHGSIVKRGYGVGLEASNALMDMYAKCECLCNTEQIFYNLPNKDIVSWTSIVSGLVRCKRPKESLELFGDMQTSGVEPDRVILTSVLSACASLGALEYGKWVHKYIYHRGIKWDSHIGTAIIDMYAKCGCIELALKTFREMPSKNVCTWNALIGGLAMHGHGHEALGHFEEMCKFGMRPNEVTFLAILTACCHSGFVDEGRRYFYQMISPSYNLSPRLEHYGCMIDLLCRAGLLDEALTLIKHMPISPDVLVWGALLNALNSSRNMELSQDILDFLMELESQDSGIYVLLSNIFAANGRWNDVERVRRLMKEKVIKKAPGSSLIEVDGETHEFVVGHTSQSCNEDIHTLLNILANQVPLEGNCVQSLLTG